MSSSRDNQQEPHAKWHAGSSVTCVSVIIICYYAIEVPKGLVRVQSAIVLGTAHTHNPCSEMLAIK